MRVLVAFDKFKEAIDAHTAVAIVAEALRSARPDLHVDRCPLTDGGDGFLDVLTGGSPASQRQTEVTDPRGRRRTSAYGILPAAAVPDAARRQLNGFSGRTLGVVEMAKASGFALTTPAKRDPWTATTYGTGELIADAARAGAEAIVVGVGGSATHDLGLGALAALGFRFETSSGERIPLPTPARWSEIAAIRRPDPVPAIPPLFIACDVDNPVFGPRGAAAIYAPQKGLPPSDFERIEREGRRIAGLLTQACGRPAQLAEMPGAGAAGGIAFGLMAGVGARLVPGFELTSDWLDLDPRLAAAALVLTGEGRFDESSLSGKGPGAIARRALALGKPVHVFAGQVSAGAQPGLTLHAISPADLPLAEALRQTRDRLGASVRQEFSA